MLMTKDNKRLMISLCIIFLAVALSYQLPHDSYSILQYAIHPIKIGNSILYLDSILCLILLIIGISGVLTAERFRRSVKFLRLLFILFILIPLMGLVIDFARITYHTVARDGIHSVDLKDTELSLVQLNNSTIINVHLVLRNYSLSNQEFGIRVYLP